MAKGVHSKRRKRNMTIKRKVFEESNFKPFKILEILRPQQERTSERLFKRTFGKGDDSMITRKKNAFRYPNDKEAIIPQQAKPVFIERRTGHISSEYFARTYGIKKKNLRKQQIEDKLAAEIKKAYAKADGLENEGRVIDMNQFNLEGDMDIEDQMNNLAFQEKGKNKKQKKTKMAMDLDEDLTTKHRHVKSKRNKKAHTKSYYMMNY